MIYLVLVGLAASAVWNGWYGVRTFQQYRAQHTLPATFRMVRLWGLVTSLTCLALLFFSSSESSSVWDEKNRVVEIVIPLIMGVQAAVLFSPPDENALEILLACPRPVAWILAERLGMALLFQIGVALVGVGVSLLLAEDQMIGLALVRWIPPTLLLMGIGAYTTLKSRVLAFGVIVASLVWIVGLFFGPLLLPGMPVVTPLDYVQPYLWAINPYLQPADLGWQDYWVNRAVVLLVGSYFVSRAAAYLRDEESVLLGTSAKRQNRKTVSDPVEVI